MPQMPEEVFRLEWFDPRSGLFDPAPSELTDGDWTSLGATPDGFGATEDWVALVTLPEPNAGAGLPVLALLLLARLERRRAGGLRR